METSGNAYDCDLSVMVARRIEAEPRRCWRNAALAVFLLPHLFANGSYVEGWIVLPRENSIEIVEHGWSTTPEHGIIDPSIMLIEERGQPISYFPGYVLSRDQLLRLLPDGTVPLVCHSQYGEDGMKHSGYQNAYSLAWQRARDVAKEKHLPQTAIKVSGRDGSRRVTVVIA